MSQLDFGLICADFRGGDREVDEAAERLLTPIRYACDYYGHGVVANAIGWRRPSLSQAVKPDPTARNRHALKLRDVAWFALNDPTGELVHTFARLRPEPANADDVVQALHDAALELFGSDGHRRLQGKTTERLLKLRRTRRAA